MNWDIIEGNWKQLKGKVKTKWGNLTNNPLDVIGGKRDQLAGKIQDSYGGTKDEADAQSPNSENGLKTPSGPFGRSN